MPSYCDRCGKKLKKVSFSEKFDELKNSFFDDWFGYDMPLLCSKCGKQLNKIIKDFVKEGKKK